MKKLISRKTAFSLVLFSIYLNANISGVVYKDFNLNGKFDANDLPVANVKVSAICDNGDSFSQVTNSEGRYNFDEVSSNSKCLIIANAKDLALGAGENTKGDSYSLVDIAKDGDTHNISLSSPATYCQTDPMVAMAALPGYYTEFYSGVYGGGQIEPSGFGTLYTIANPKEGEFNGQDSIDSKRKTLAKIEDTGAIWGVAYKKSTKEIFASAVIKRYVPFKDNDVNNAGNIYKISDIDTNPKVELFAKIPNVLSDEAISDLSNRDYGLNQDLDVWKKYAAREGIGDIDISEDESRLFAMNMNTKSIVVLDAKSGNILKTSKVPNPYGTECEDEMVRPWALKVKGNAVYVGSVCENKIKDPFGVKLGASIQKCDLNGENCVEIARTNALTYLKPKGYRPEDGNANGAYNYTNWGEYGKEDYKYGPILTDIEFTNKGDLILGYTARNSFVRTAGMNGDIRKMCLQSDGSYVDEINNDGSPSDICKPHAVKYDQKGENNETYYEFYTGDFSGDDLGANSHPEVAYGALAQIPGMPFITVGMIAYTADNEPGALGVLSNLDGSKKAAQAVIKNAYVNDGGEREPYGAKAGGMGDIELLCDAAPVELGDYVWMDLNKNGLQEPNEPAMRDVPVKLYCKENGKDRLYGEAKTDINGHYYFGGLDSVNMLDGKRISPDMECRVEIAKANVNNQDATVANVDSNSKDNIDNDAVVKDDKNVIEFKTTLNNDHSLDFGINPAYGCVRGVIFEDINGNGINDDNKAVSGVTLTLYDSEGNIAKDKDGNEVEEFVTGSDGKYEFCDLILNQNYRVKAKLPDGYYITKANSGSEDSDSDFDKNATASTDYANGLLKLDAGVFKPVCIGDYVWNDKNANGMQDDDEKGIANVKVSLLDKNGTIAKDINGDEAVTNTDNNGKYNICNLYPGEYKVKFEIESNDSNSFVATKENAGDDSKDSDIKANTIGGGQTDIIELKSGENNNTIDAGFVQNICIGDLVWYDRNLNGIQDEDLSKDAVVDVKVSLYDSNNNLIATTSTNSEGRYRFCNLNPNSDYRLKFDIPETYLATKANVGDDDRDSDANSNGWVDVSSSDLKSYLEEFNDGNTVGLINPNFDMGIYCSCDDYKVNGGKKLSGSAFNILGLLALILSFGLISRKRDN